MFKGKWILLGLLFVIALAPVIASAQGGNVVYLPVISNAPAEPPPTPPPGIGDCSDLGNPILESFEATSGWAVTVDALGGGQVVRSSDTAGGGTYSAAARTTGAGQVAAVRAAIQDASLDHTWLERPGTYLWQQACVYIPSTTVAQLGSGQYLDLAAYYPSAGGLFGWWLRLRPGGALHVVGFPFTGVQQETEFNVYGTVPTDRWFTLEIGLHTQAGPGIKRAFAFIIDGNVYGWYHQGNMAEEVFDRANIGVVRTNSSNTLLVYVDQWRNLGTEMFPNGPDHRSTGALQVHDFRHQSGIEVQMDWSTWALDLRLDPTYGLYSATDRLQAGHNLYRGPDYSNGWAEITIDWPQGTPPAQPNGYFAGMVGFRKDLAREENLEVIPYGNGDGTVNLYLEAWVHGAPIVLQSWPLPAASNVSGSHIPEPGDTIRVRWEMVSATQLRVVASYYDASTNTWHPNVFNSYTFDISSIGVPGVDFTDGYHHYSEMTIDTRFYSLRTETVGTLPTYPGP